MHMPNPLSLDHQASAEGRRVIGLLVVAGFFLSFGFNSWSALFNNFAVEMLSLDAQQVGWIQSLREIPGLLGFVLAWIVIVMPEMRLTGLCVVLMGAGLLLTAGSRGFGELLLGTMVMSIGFHFFDSTNASLVLTYASKESAPRVLGVLGAIGAATAVAGTLAIVALARPLGYRTLIYLLGGLTLAGGMIVLILGRQGATEKLRRRIVFRRRYWLYYLLTFLFGSRRHIFTTFATFLMVKIHHMPVQQMAILFLVNSLATTLCYGEIGRLTARLGERAVLSANFALLVAIFVGYAYITWLPLLLVFFVVDNVLFGTYLALNTYFQKIAQSTEEITANISVGQTINHLSAVFVPVLGGRLWELYGYQATFLAGALIALLGLLLTPWLRAARPQPVLEG